MTQPTGKHRKHIGNVGKINKFTAFGAATVTATALTVGASPLPARTAAAKVADADVVLAAAINHWPDPDRIPDLTAGFGSAAYNLGQSAADLLIRGIVENFNLAALARAAGADPDTVLETLFGGVLGQIPTDLLADVIGAIPIDVTGVVAALLDPLGVLSPGIRDQLAGILSGPLPKTLGGLLGLIGLDLGDALNLSNLAGPANIITAGPAFTLLKLLGADLGWVPGLPNSVADEVNSSPYLNVRVSLSDVLDKLGVLGQVVDLLHIEIPDLNAVQVRVPIVVGFGLGAYSAGAAYDQIVKNLQNQPGGPSAAEESVLGSITVLPMILLRNPGRANGGLFARFYPLLGLLGIHTVTPEAAATNSGGTIPLLGTGLALGGANLIPVKVDGTVQYDPLSDFAAWPNPFSLLNNLAAGMLPTYILRGLTVDNIPEELTTQLDDILAGAVEGDPLTINLYLTLASATLPLLEPLYLAADMVNLMTGGMLGPANPFSLVANALAPALTSLVNLGYTDVVYDPETGGYVRTLTEAGDPTAFLSFPKINWSQVPGVIFKQLVAGIKKEFFSGHPTPGTPNAIRNLLNFLRGELPGGLPLGDLPNLVEDIVGGTLGKLSPKGAASETGPAQAASLPSENSRTLTLATDGTSTHTTESDGSKAPVVSDADGPAAGEEEAGDEVDKGADNQEPAEDDAATEEPADEDRAEDAPAEEGPVDEQPADDAEHETPISGAPVRTEPDSGTAGDNEGAKPDQDGSTDNAGGAAGAAAA